MHAQLRDFLKELSASFKKITTSLALAGTMAVTTSLNAEQPKNEDKTEPHYLDAIVNNYVLGGEKPLKKELPPRMLTPAIFSNDNIADLRNGFEANTHQWHTTNELMGKGSDYAGITLGADKYLMTRIGLFLVHSTLLTMPNYFSHELSHGFYSRWKGDDVFKVDWGFSPKSEEFFETGDFQVRIVSSGLSIERFGLGFVRVARTTDDAIFNDDSDLDARIFNITAGFNQQEENVRFLYTQDMKEGGVFF